MNIHGHDYPSFEIMVVLAIQYILEHNHSASMNRIFKYILNTFSVSPVYMEIHLKYQLSRLVRERVICQSWWGYPNSKFKITKEYITKKRLELIDINQ
uniref:Linker histone H1 and H5 family protein n=1 Tax=Pithovirus LCPAC101 TaxID=2506586 RepID=A0A481Z2R7_9VIRU|nr:MAG: linker histone H1 and H5 family protein [Pithovirus LCPAC101]